MFPMPKDPIVEEVWETRREIERECGASADAYFEHLQQVQKKWRERLVRRQPQPAPEVKLAS